MYKEIPNDVQIDTKSDWWLVTGDGRLSHPRSEDDLLESQNR